MSKDEKRYASSQAWNRVRDALGPGEARDIARDISDYAGGDAYLIELALLHVDWAARRQA